MRAGGLPPATLATWCICIAGFPPFNEGRGVTPGDAKGYGLVYDALAHVQ